MSKTTIKQLEAQLQSALLKQALWIDYPDTSDKGAPLGTVANTETLLNHYKITVRYNEMTKEQEIVIPNMKFHADTANNVQLTHLEDLAKQTSLPHADIVKHIDLIANQNAYHPVRDWLKSLKWDGKSRLNDYYATIETTTTPEMKELFMRKFALSIVAACMREDYRFGAEGVLVLLGGQAAAKTSYMSSILPRKNTQGWVITGCTVDPHNKDTLIKALGGIITEMGEMGTTFKKSDKESLKQFLTEKVDIIRMPYDRKPNKYSRRTVFFGTSNELTILDDTENRRYWPLQDVAFPKHKLDIEQFWAEMYAMYIRVLPLCDTRADSLTSGEWGWYLSPTEREALTVEQEEMRTISPVAEKLQHALRASITCDDEKDKCDWLSATIICERAGIMNPNKGHANEAAAWLKKAGYPYSKRDKKYAVMFYHDDESKVLSFSENKKKLMEKFAKR